MTLNLIWFILIAVLFIGYALLDGINLGIGASYLSYKDEKDRRFMLNVIGPFWNGNEVWLLTAGGALFAAFPNAYASLFSGLYLALILLLVGIIFRGISVEFRNKEEGDKWRQRWDYCLSISSIIILLVLGVAVGNIIQGLPIDANGNIHINLLALFTPLPIVIGLQSVFFFAMHGSFFAAMKSEGDTKEMIMKKAKLFACVSLLLFVGSFFLVGNYSITSIVLNIFCILLIAVLIFIANKPKAGIALLLSGITAIIYIANIAINQFPNFVVSTIDKAFSLNMTNAASSEKTLTIMLIIAGVGVPIMLAYTIFVYRVFKGRINKQTQNYD